MTYQFFNELLLGEGFWLGLLIMIGVGLYIGSRVRFSSIIFVIVYLFLAMFYNDNLAVSFRLWGIICCLLAMMFSTYQLYSDATSTKN